MQIVHQQLITLAPLGARPLVDTNTRSGSSTSPSRGIRVKDL